MWSLLRPRPPPLTIVQLGGICLVFFQLARSEAACESAESCLGYPEPSSSPWYFWFCMSLFLATILLCVALCCLQRWLTRCRRFSSQRTVAVFALSDADSMCENDVVPGQVPKVHPHPQGLERYSSCSRSDAARDGPPPSYEEIVKPVSTRPARPSRDVAPGEQQSSRGPAEESQQSQT